MIESAIAVLLRSAAGSSIANKSQVRPSSEVSNVITDPLPMIIYAQLDSQEEMTDDGPTGVIVAPFNIDIYTSKATEARNILNEIRAALNGYSGMSDGTRIDLIQIKRTKLLQGFLQEGSNQTLARLAIEMIVTYRD